ncbi:hypothetical protein D9M68_628740 [compost metagenome]
MSISKHLVLSLSVTLTAGIAAANPETSQLAPWPAIDGNYLQLHQDAHGTWFITAAVVKGGKVATSLAKVERPSNPASLLQQHMPLASIHVRGIECESLEYKHLVVDRNERRENYWMAIPRGITTPKPTCQIKNTPERWQFVVS